MTEVFKNLFRYFRQILLRSYVLKTTPFTVTDESVLIIAPHPDDETFGTAGLIAQKTNANALVSVVFLTNGENSLKESSTQEITLNRRKTASDTCTQLGVKHIYYCNFTDGNIPRRDMPEYDNSLEVLLQLIKTINPSEVFCTHNMEGWSDHTAGSELTCDALKKLNTSITLYYYWVWIWFSTPIKKIKFLNFNNTFYLKINNVMNQKESAILSYLSNVNKQGNAYCGKLPTMFLKAFKWPYEVYEKVEYK